MKIIYNIRMLVGLDTKIAGVGGNGQKFSGSKKTLLTVVSNFEQQVDLSV